jgi:hypothetical protein
LHEKRNGLTSYHFISHPPHTCSDLSEAAARDVLERQLRPGHQRTLYLRTVPVRWVLYGRLEDHRSCVQSGMHRFSPTSVGVQTHGIPPTIIPGSDGTLRDRRRDQIRDRIGQAHVGNGPPYTGTGLACPMKLRKKHASETHAQWPRFRMFPQAGNRDKGKLVPHGFTRSGSATLPFSSTSEMTRARKSRLFDGRCFEGLPEAAHVGHAAGTEHVLLSESLTNCRWTIIWYHSHHS